MRPPTSAATESACPSSATRSTPRFAEDDEDVPLMRILAEHCMPHAAVPRLVSEHVVMLFMARPSVDLLRRLESEAFVPYEEDDPTDRDEVTRRNALPVALLQLKASGGEQAASLPLSFDLPRMCALHHRSASLKVLAQLMGPPCPDTRAFRAWCLLRLCDAEGPDTDRERRLRAVVLSHMQRHSWFLSCVVGRDELFLRVARRQHGMATPEATVQCTALVFLLENVMFSRNVFATAEFFDEFFLKFAWLHRGKSLYSVIRCSNGDRLRSCLTTAFRDAYFRGTVSRLSCNTFRPQSRDDGRSAFGALQVCVAVTAVAAERGIRFPATEILRDFIIELTAEALRSRLCPADLGATLCLFEVLLRHCTDFTALGTVVFLNSFFLEVAGALGLGSAECDVSNTAGRAALIKMLALVTQHAFPSEIAVFATSRVRDQLLVPLGLSVHGEAYPAEVRAAFTAAFTAIARTEDGSLRTAFDTEAVRSALLPRLA